MAISSGDIQFVLSGGAFNNLPAKSLGGEPSNAPITGGVDALFSDISKDQAINGHTDYRCFYIFNRNAESALRYVEACISSQTENGATCMLGTKKSTEVQDLCISTRATNGTLSLQYEHHACDCAWESDPHKIANNIAEALNTSKVGLSGVIVKCVEAGPNFVFRVSFAGIDDFTSHEMVEVIDTKMNANVKYASKRVTHGSPINAVAEQIANGATEPQDIAWEHTSPTSRIAIGDLRPNEGFFLWVKRTIEAGTPALQKDGITIKIVGQS